MINISDKALEAIEKVIGEGNIRKNEPMKHHTSMEVGGPAAWFFTPEDQEGIAAVLVNLQQEGIPYYIIGKGSNVIFRDEGYDGAVICLADNYSGYEIISADDETAVVSVKAGTSNRDFSDAMINEGLAGFEFASGIPGSIGGATAMNAGAYDGEMKHIIREVKLLDEQGNVIVRSNEEMDLSYRHSLVSSGGYTVLETVLNLKKDDPAAIQARVDDLTARREEKQPLEYPSCGSTFKRPEGYFAGKLISDSGLKGYRHGGAQVSEKHAGFVINRDNATASEILELIEYVKTTVLEKQGVLLECEVKIL
ncbi:MAG: UDP-N-acetylmuramate dehydrogenase [Parasporobacterium sp.]|nr:UDP-N-acetylmuramate dehydrogenase [Parasporobacterium sp.]